MLFLFCEDMQICHSVTVCIIADKRECLCECDKYELVCVLDLVFKISMFFF